MPELGKKFTCYSCHTKFYDLGKPTPICPKCGADQRDAEEAPVHVPTRGRRAAPVVVEEPIEEPDFAAEGDAPVAAGEEGEEEDVVIEPEPVEEDEDEDEEY